MVVFGHSVQLTWHQQIISFLLSTPYTGLFLVVGDVYDQNIQIF
jgi:hypothetical protein